jgi:serine/threonine-protein kinase
MKILLPELAGREELAARFLREIKLVASLDHPNIASLRTAMMIEDQLIMVMEFVEGTSLDARLNSGPLPVAEALEYTDQALAALAYAHQRGVVHRDIKPANMMLTPEGVVKVMDFGVAFSGSEHKLTSTGTTLGSLAYMSPEQVRGETADPRSDLYSVGISLYELVTGQRPFHADSDYAIMAAHVQQAPRPPIELQPGLPASLNGAILRAIAKEKDDRFQSADEFRVALSNVASEVSTGVATSTMVVTPSFPVATGSRPAAQPTQPLRPAVPKTQAIPPSRPAPVAAPPAPAAQATAPAPPPPAARQSGGNRTLYMTLGAVLALTLLIVIGSYYKSAAVATDEKKPAPAPATAPAPAPAPAPEAKAEEKPAPADAAKPAPKPAAPAPPDNSAQLAELERQLDQLTSRALAADSRLTTLRQQQRASGYDLRGDIAAKWESMKLNLGKAQDAFDKRDHVRGKQYADMAENTLSQLERFLGR